MSSHYFKRSVKLFFEKSCLFKSTHSCRLIIIPFGSSVKVRLLHKGANDSVELGRTFFRIYFDDMLDDVPYQMKGRKERHLFY